jgi:hypothetical protein
MMSMALITGPAPAQAARAESAGSYAYDWGAYRHRVSVCDSRADGKRVRSEFFRTNGNRGTVLNTAGYATCRDDTSGSTVSIQKLNACYWEWVAYTCSYFSYN